MLRKSLMLSLTAAASLALTVSLATAQPPAGAPQPPAPPGVAPPAPVPSPYLVKFRLFGAVRQQVVPDHEAAHSLEERLAKVGVQAEIVHDNGTYAVRYSCPAWKVAEAPDHEEAHELEEWLTSLGFDAYVKHMK